VACDQEREAAAVTGQQGTFRSFGGTRPSVADDAVVLGSATVIGAVEIGSQANLWYGCVVRADQERIIIGASSNVQDTAVLHADPGFPAVVGERVTLGHGAVLHGARVDDDCIIGMRAVLLNGAHIGAGSIVAAGTVVLPGTSIPPRSLVAGVPGSVKRATTEDELRQIERSAEGYVQLAREHRLAD
jgi:carbonic anhydrase/acetyltransferase-like protein (isoleucine patch superfamily)